MQQRQCKYKVELRRCSCSCVFIDSNLEIVFSSMFPLAGPIQTVPRAELFAICQVVANVSHGKVRILSDSKVNVDLYGKSRASALASTNGDLWLDIFRHIDAKSLESQLKWIPGHLDTKASERHAYSDFEFALNYYADKLADAAAARIEVCDLNVIMPVVYGVKVVTQINRRLSAILCSGLFPKSQVPKPQTDQKPLAK